MTHLPATNSGAVSPRNGSPGSAAAQPTTPRTHRSATIRGGTVRFAERTVLHRIDLSVGRSERIAVIGDNGSGKSTLLGVLAGTIELASGERHLELPGGLAWAQQQPTFPAGATIADALDQLLADVLGINRKVQLTAEALSHAPAPEHPALLQRLSGLMQLFEARDGHGLELRVSAALEQLGLGGLDRGHQVNSLSGGERSRLALAAALSLDAELLLLDEPTNDLDGTGIGWLEDRLTSHRGALVVASHDRAFLDRFATDILAVADGTLRRYGNGYAGYLNARAAEHNKLLGEHEAWRQEVARTEAMLAANTVRAAAIPRKMEKAGFGHGAFKPRSRSHGAVSKIRMARERLTRLSENPAPRPPDPLHFSPSFPGHAAPHPTDDAGESPLLVAGGVRLGSLETPPRLELDALTIRAGERWLVSGANGSGKTTLLRILAGELLPEVGTVQARPGLRVAWLRQDLANPSPRRLLQAFAEATGSLPEEGAELLLHMGLFQPDAFARRLPELSVGQLRRLELAIALAAPTDLLLLDEPTNHLSPELADQLEDALIEYPGAVVTVSHDRRWRARITAAGARELQVHAAGRVGQACGTALDARPRCP